MVSHTCKKTIFIIVFLVLGKFVIPVQSRPPFLHLHLYDQDEIQLVLLMLKPNVKLPIFWSQLLLHLIGIKKSERILHCSKWVILGWMFALIVNNAFQFVSIYNSQVLLPVFINPMLFSYSLLLRISRLSLPGNQSSMHWFIIKIDKITLIFII